MKLHNDKNQKVFEYKDVIDNPQNKEKDQIIYIGSSLLEKVYNCPNNRCITLDNTDSYKIGLLLLGI
jgi:hypothetical protein